MIEKILHMFNPFLDFLNVLLFLSAKALWYWIPHQPYQIIDCLSDVIHFKKNFKIMTSDCLSVTTRGMLVLHRHMVHFAWPFDLQSQLGGPLRLDLKPICRAWVSAAVPQTWIHVHSWCHCPPPPQVIWNCLSAWSRLPSAPVDFHSDQFCGVPRLTFHWFCFFVPLANTIFLHHHRNLFGWNALALNASTVPIAGALNTSALDVCHTSRLILSNTLSLPNQYRSAPVMHYFMFFSEFHAFDGVILLEGTIVIRLSSFQLFFNLCWMFVWAVSIIMKKCDTSRHDLISPTQMFFRAWLLFVLNSGALTQFSDQLAHGLQKACLI